MNAAGILTTLFKETFFQEDGQDPEISDHVPLDAEAEEFGVDLRKILKDSSSEGTSNFPTSTNEIDDQCIPKHTGKSTAVLMASITVLDLETRGLILRTNLSLSYQFLESCRPSGVKFPFGGCRRGKPSDSQQRMQSVCCRDDIRELLFGKCPVFVYRSVVPAVETFSMKVLFLCCSLLGLHGRLSLLALGVVRAVILLLRRGLFWRVQCPIGRFEGATLIKQSSLLGGRWLSSRPCSPVGTFLSLCKPVPGGVVSASPLAVRLRRLERRVAILTLCDGDLALGRVAVELDETMEKCGDCRVSAAETFRGIQQAHSGNLSASPDAV